MGDTVSFKLCDDLMNIPFNKLLQIFSFLKSDQGVQLLEKTYYDVNTNLKYIDTYIDSKNLSGERARDFFTPEVREQYWADFVREFDYPEFHELFANIK